MLSPKSSLLTIALVLGSLLFAGTRVEMASARRDAPLTPHDRAAMREVEVRQLLLQMEPDKDGKITRQEWLSLMGAEFDKLDVSKNGALDPRQLAQTRPSSNQTASLDGK